MNLIEVPERGLRFNMPSKLGECNSREYAAMCHLFFKYQCDEITYEELKYLAVYGLLNLKPSENSEHQENIESNIYQIATLVEGFFNHLPENKIELKQDFQHNPIPKIPVANGFLTGPQDYLKDVNFGQYVIALNIFSTFNADPEAQLLYDLAAVFYRRKGIAFDENKIEKNSKTLKQTDFGYIYGFYIFFASFQYFITSAVVTWEGKEADLSILFKSTGDAFISELPGLGMKSTAFMLAETNILGNLKDVNHTNIWEVLFLMYDIRKNDLDEKKKAEQHKKKSGYGNG